MTDALNRCTNCGIADENVRPAVSIIPATHAPPWDKACLQAALAKLRECKPVLVARREALHEEADDWTEAGDLLSASEAREEAALVDTLLASLPREG